MLHPRLNQKLLSCNYIRNIPTIKSFDTIDTKNVSLKVNSQCCYHLVQSLLALWFDVKISMQAQWKHFNGKEV